MLAARLEDVLVVLRWGGGQSREMAKNDNGDPNWPFFCIKFALKHETLATSRGDNCR